MKFRCSAEVTRFGFAWLSEASTSSAGLMPDNTGLRRGWSSFKAIVLREEIVLSGSCWKRSAIFRATWSAWWSQHWLFTLPLPLKTCWSDVVITSAAYCGMVYMARNEVTSFAGSQVENREEEKVKFWSESSLGREQNTVLLIDPLGEIR